jgi:hypothetical protein
MKVEYDSNNSGGYWWLTDQDWYNLERAGWEVNWVKNDEFFKGSERWLGALAMRATKVGLSISEARREWENITGQDSYASGCECCGPPHIFTEYNDVGGWIYDGQEVHDSDD